jgi:YD repeat-containing protein
MNLIQYTQSHKNKTTDYTNPDSELYDVEYDEFGKLKNKLDQILVRLKSITPLNTNYFTDIFTQFYIENYNSLINKEMYYHPIVLNYNDERLNSNMNQYVFLYPKYRTVGLNKIVINDGYTYIDDSNHNFTQEKLVSISVPENKPVNDKLKLVNPVYRDIIETYETLGNDLYVYQDVYYGFGEYEIKPKFEISKYFLEIIDTSSNSDEFV